MDELRRSFHHELAAVSDELVRLAASVTEAIPRATAVLLDGDLEGADYLQRVFMFTPNPVQPGSSVSHYDTLAKPNLLMEPFDTPHQPIAVSPPQDLTLQLLLDIGWGN